MLPNTRLPTQGPSSIILWPSVTQGNASSSLYSVWTSPPQLPGNNQIHSAGAMEQLKSLQCNLLSKASLHSQIWLPLNQTTSRTIRSPPPEHPAASVVSENLRTYQSQPLCGPGPPSPRRPQTALPHLQSRILQLLTARHVARGSIVGYLQSNFPSSPSSVADWTQDTILIHTWLPTSSVEE